MILHSQFPVTLDRGTGLGSAGGYVGSGLTATNLVGRTLADLVLGNDYDLTDLPGPDAAHDAGNQNPSPAARTIGLPGE